ncbi:MAG: hypothetical protein ACXACI_09365 [Candidatus Hodarchaeales archaeon]
MAISNIDLLKGFSEASTKNYDFLTNVDYTLDLILGAGANFGILGNGRIEGETVISVNLEES